MRLLHIGHDHGRSRAPEAKPEPVAAGYHALHGREHLPLRHLSAHPRGHQTGREHEGRSKPMKRRHLTSSGPVNPPLTPPRRGTNPRQRGSPLVDGLAVDLSSQSGPCDASLERERYELHAAPVYNFDLARRDFFKTLGSGIVVLFLLEDVLAQESGGGRRRGGSGQRRPQELGAWLHIGEDGVVTVFTGKAEVGQNIRTSL